VTDEAQAAIDALKEQAKAKRQEASAERPDYPKWKPVNPGDSIGGKLRTGEWVSTKYGDTPVLTVEKPDGEIVEVWCSTSMLENWIRDEAPAIGATILIEFDGKRPTKDGQFMFNAYTCMTDEYDYSHWMDSLMKMQAKKATYEALNPAGSSNAYGGQNRPGNPPVQRTAFGPDEAPF